MSQKIRLERVEELCSTQEETDTKIFLHANHATALGHSSILIKSSDKDVEVMALYFKWDIQARLYLLKGTKNKSRLIDITAIGDKLGNDICIAMPGLHAFTGSDTTSAFSGKGKVKPLRLIEKNQGHCETMKRIGNSFDIDQSLIESCEIFVSELYGALANDINEARYYLFCTRNTTSEQLPPTKNTLTKHLLRANYQCAIWKAALQSNANIPPPSGHGYKIENRQLSVDWIGSLPAPIAILELLSCKCRGDCSTNRCSRYSNHLVCTDCCSCSENCQNQSEEAGTSVNDLSDDEDE